MVSLAGSSLTSSQDFHQFSASSRLEHDHEGGDNDHGSEDRKERRRRPAVREEEEDEEDEKEEEDKDEEDEVEEDGKYHKPPALTPADGPLSGSQSHDKSEANSGPFENKVTISTFGSIMRITSSSSLNSSSKIRKISSGDYKFSKSLCKSSQLSTPPILEEAGLEDKAMPPTLPRERRHRGSKKSSHGPGRPRGSKNRERREEEHHHHHHTAALPPPPPPPPPPTLTSSLYPSSIPHPTFSSTLPLTTISSFSSSSFSSSTSSFSTSRGNSLLNSGEYVVSTTHFLRKRNRNRSHIIIGVNIAVFIFSLSLKCEFFRYTSAVAAVTSSPEPLIQQIINNMTSF